MNILGLIEKVEITPITIENYYKPIVKGAKNSNITAILFTWKI